MLHLAKILIFPSKIRISSIPPIDLGERGGRTGMRKKSVRCKMCWGLFLDFCDFFQNICGLERDKHQNKKGAKVPTFPFLVVLTEKCVSGVIF